MVKNSSTCWYNWYISCISSWHQKDGIELCKRQFLLDKGVGDLGRYRGTWPINPWYRGSLYKGLGTHHQDSTAPMSLCPLSQWPIFSIPTVPLSKFPTVSLLTFQLSHPYCLSVWLPHCPVSHWPLVSLPHWLTVTLFHCPLTHWSTVYFLTVPLCYSPYHLTVPLSKGKLSHCQVSSLTNCLNTTFSHSHCLTNQLFAFPVFLPFLCSISQKDFTSLRNKTMFLRQGTKFLLLLYSRTSKIFRKQITFWYCLCFAKFPN